jgi:hypothetical protein
LQGFTNRLVSADKLLAKTAINDAGVDGIAQPNDELSKGDPRALDGKSLTHLDILPQRDARDYEAITHIMRVSFFPQPPCGSSQDLLVRMQVNSIRKSKRLLNIVCEDSRHLHCCQKHQVPVTCPA